MTCLHEEITTWYFDDTNQPAGMWSCKSCGHKFVPMKLWIGLTDEEYDELMLSGDWGGSLIQATQTKLKEKNT